MRGDSALGLAVGTWQKPAAGRRRCGAGTQPLLPAGVLRGLSIAPASGRAPPWPAGAAAGSDSAIGCYLEALSTKANFARRCWKPGRTGPVTCLCPLTSLQVSISLRPGRPARRRTCPLDPAERSAPCTSAISLRRNVLTGPLRHCVRSDFARGWRVVAAGNGRVAGCACH